jgi:hypothetical protein
MTDVGCARARMTTLGGGEETQWALGAKRAALRFGERDAHGKATTEILHVVQNDGP